MAIQIQDENGVKLEMTTRKHAKITSEVDVNNNPSNVGGFKFYSENDNGEITGSYYLLSPETDDDYRLRIAQDTILDDETFSYTAQNTGKHYINATTMTSNYTTGGLITNASNITTASTGLGFSTYAYFPMFNSGLNLYCQFEASFSEQPTTNTIIDVGMFIRSNANPYNNIDGTYFRLNSSGLVGVVNSNGTESTTSPLSFTYVENTVYSFLIVISNKSVEFWIDDILYGKIETPIGQAQPFMSSALPFSLRHSIVGGVAGSFINFTLRGYGISIGGMNFSKTLSEIGNGTFGSYQGLSGGTMGSLTSYTNSTNPTAAVPSNTALTANLPSGLGGQAWETFTSGLAMNTDGILMSYQVPVGTVSLSGKRLKIRGVKMSAFVRTDLTAGGFVSTFALAFGHTSISMATTESANSKQRRIVLLPEFTHSVPASSLNGTLLVQSSSYSNFDEPIYVNPGEFIAFTVKHIGVAATSGVIAYNIQYVYGWE